MYTTSSIFIFRCIYFESFFLPRSFSNFFCVDDVWYFVLDIFLPLFFLPALFELSHASATLFLGYVVLLFCPLRVFGICFFMVAGIKRSTTRVAACGVHWLHKQRRYSIFQAMRCFINPISHSGFTIRIERFLRKCIIVWCVSYACATSAPSVVAARTTLDGL